MLAALMDLFHDATLQVTKERLEGMQEKLSKAQLDKMGLEQKVRTHQCCQIMPASTCGLLSQMIGGIELITGGGSC